jgi:hypothetical protein
MPIRRAPGGVRVPTLVHVGNLAVEKAKWINAAYRIISNVSVKVDSARKADGVAV